MMNVGDTMSTSGDVQLNLVHRVDIYKSLVVPNSLRVEHSCDHPV